MEYYIMPSALKNTFQVPESVVKKHFKLANEVQLKVLLTALCFLEWDFDSEKIAEHLAISTETVRESLDFWSDLKLMGKTGAPSEPATKAVTGNVIKPSRDEVTRRGLESSEIAFLLNEAQKKFGRALRQNEASTLVWLCDDNGLPVSVLIMLLEYAASVNRLNISFIEKTAVKWVNNGIVTVADAEKEIETLNRRYGAYGVMAEALHIRAPKPTEEMLKCADLWVNKWEYGADVIGAAYDVCVNKTGGFNLNFIKKVIERWHKEGVKTRDDIKQNKKADNSDGGDIYDRYDDLLMDKV